MSLPKYKSEEQHHIALGLKLVGVEVSLSLQDKIVRAIDMARESKGEATLMDYAKMVTEIEKEYNGSTEEEE